MAKELIIYTDGGCRGNGKQENIGGIGIVFLYDDEVVGTIAKGYRNTTNNIMELTAMITSFESIPELIKIGKLPEDIKDITIYTDSQYCMNAFTDGWLRNWKKNGWRTAAGGAVKNIEIWKKLDAYVSSYSVKFEKVAGHSGDVFNEMADNLVNDAMDMEANA